MGVLKALRWQNNPCFTPKERNGKRWSKEEKNACGEYNEATPPPPKQTKREREKERNHKEAGKLLICLGGAKNL